MSFYDQPPPVPTARDLQLIEVALDSAIQACVGFRVPNAAVDSLVEEYRHALDWVVRFELITGRQRHDAIKRAVDQAMQFGRDRAEQAEDERQARYQATRDRLARERNAAIDAADEDD